MSRHPWAWRLTAARGEPPRPGMARHDGTVVLVGRGGRMGKAQLIELRVIDGDEGIDVAPVGVGHAKNIEAKLLKAIGPFDGRERTIGDLSALVKDILERELGQKVDVYTSAPTDKRIKLKTVIIGSH